MRAPCYYVAAGAAASSLECRRSLIQYQAGGDTQLYERLALAWRGGPRMITQ